VKRRRSRSWCSETQREKERRRSSSNSGSIYSKQKVNDRRRRKSFEECPLEDVSAAGAQRRISTYHHN